MKKRIEEDDVIYTIDKNSGDCIDIDVKPGVEEVSFNASFGREYLLGNCKKVFPDVRKIVIDYSVYDIDIPNTLCLLSKDGLVLVKYLSAISGTVHIPDGIETITSYAFILSEAEEIYFPDSLRVLMPKCFWLCNKLQKVDFGHGIEEIGIGHVILVLAV